MYLRWDLAAPKQTTAPEGLARVNPATGEILAVNTSIGESMSAPACAAGFLWVTDSAANGEHLLRLNKQTLAVTGQVKLTRGSSPYPGAYGWDSHIAFAGGLVWADGASG